MDSIKTVNSTRKRLRHFSKKTGGLCRNGLHVIAHESFDGGILNSRGREWVQMSNLKSLTMKRSGPSKINLCKL